MYIWKCWRDTRSFFLAFVIISVLAIPVAGAVGVGSTLIGGFGMNVLLPMLVFILFVVALGLGTIGATHEFTDNTAQFLFTKPRSRAYFVWAGWAIGSAELITIALVNLLAGMLTLAHYNKGTLKAVVLGSLRWQDALSIIVYGLFIYSLTYALTAVLRNGLKGLGASMGTMVVLQSIAIAAQLRWNVTIPVPPVPIASRPVVISHVIWMFFALLSVFAAQMVIERAEI